MKSVPLLLAFLTLLTAPTPSLTTPLSIPATQRQLCTEDSDCRSDEVCIGICLDSTLTCSCDRPCEGDLLCIKNPFIDDLTQCIPSDALDGSPIKVEQLECPGGGSSSDGGSNSDGGSTNNPPGEGTSQAEQETEDAVCIAVDMLTHFASHQLVFAKHALARVLCDTAGSCATNGHIVNYDGTPMMMLNYCSIVGCKEKVMLVNSPKYQPGLKVQSRSNRMHFTPFAARYQTSAEEAVLAAAVRLGF